MTTRALIFGVVAALALAISAAAQSMPGHDDQGMMPGTMPHEHAAMTRSPYAGQQHRAIKALSAEEIEGLKNGMGLGMAKAGELNGYPGPLHVLQLRSELKLTRAQLQAITAIKDRMSADAKPLGIAIIARERDLDRQFVTGKITEASLEARTQEIGAMRGRLRAVHLLAHLKTKAQLTPEQVARYDELRGYAAAPPSNKVPGPKRQGG